MKNLLTIAGSDCSGGAGIQADLKTFAAHGVYGMSVIVSVVAENTSRVYDIQNVSPEIIGKQIDAVFQDIQVDGVKIGMLANEKCMEIVAKKLKKYRPQNVVVDPVMYAKNGCPLMEPHAVNTLINSIIPLADVLTPNIPEAEEIADMRISSLSDMEEAARKIHSMGCRYVVVKGGHSSGAAVDLLFDGRKAWFFEAARIDTCNTHGTGCTFSSAIAAQLAKGMPVYRAVDSSKEYITTAISHALSIGKGHGPTHHFYELYKYGLGQRKDYSIYLVTDRSLIPKGTLADSIEQAILGGCTMVQLREKNISTDDYYLLAKEVKSITDKYNIPLIINDRVDIALAVHADGVHLGQSDIPASVARDIIGDDMILGISATTVEEAAKAAVDGADYLGIGAMFPTSTKTDAKLVDMDELRKIRSQIHIPIVAIGGISEDNAPLLAEAGVDGLAAVSAIMGHDDIMSAARGLKNSFIGR